MEYVTLNTEKKMPMLGLGVFLVKDKEACKNAVYHAIKSGYRLIDTAAYYQNEDAVGAAVRRAIEEGVVKREDLFITTKLWVQDISEDGAKYGIERSLSLLGLDYIDLYLIHQALGDYFSAYRVLQNAYKEGTLKAIGVSNFYPSTLANFCETMEITPAVNQIELHPYLAQKRALECAKYYGVIPQAWGPLGQGRFPLFEDERLNEIAKSHEKTVAQVALRWNLQRGVAVIPKSARLERIEENFDVFDFTLTDQEMAYIDSLDLGYHDEIKHFKPEFVRDFMSRKIHD